MKAAMLLGALVMVVSSNAFAATGFFNTKVYYQAGDTTSGSSVGFANAGSSMGLCTGSIPGPTNDRILRIPDNANGDKMRAVILAAVLAGKTLQATWDDSVRDASNRCYVRSVTITVG